MNSGYRHFVFILSFSALCILASCTMEKRVHRRGVHVEWLSHKKPARQQAPVRVAEKPLVTVHHLEQGEDTTLLAQRQPEQAGVQVPVSKPGVLQQHALEAAEPCDLLVLRNGEEWSVKVLEVTGQEIVYTSCDPGNDTELRIAKSKVFMIKYGNGLKELMKEEPRNPQKMKDAPRHHLDTKGGQRTHPGAITAFILSLLSIFFLGAIAAIPALIVGKKALREIQHYPRVYKGEGLARAAVIISGIILAFLLIAVLIVIIFFVVLIAQSSRRGTI